MSRFNSYFVNHFGGCRHLASTHDQHRNRDVKIYQVPGYSDVVGVTDGVDCWVAPVSHEIFKVDIKKLLADLQAGKAIHLPVTAGLKSSARRRISFDEGDSAPPEAQNEPKARPSQSQRGSRRAAFVE